jgi:hypothetical protein
MLWAYLFRVSIMKVLFPSRLIIQSGLIILISLLAGCTRDASDPERFTSSSRSSITNSASSSSDSSVTAATLSGTISFDRVPHKTNHLGLDYLNIQIKPARGVVVDLLNASDEVIASQITTGSGQYSFAVALNQQVQIRVLAQLKNTEGGWNISVRDNTGGDALYAVQGALTAVSSENEIRNLHMASGWNGTAYMARSAGPFAILDSIYLGIDKWRAAGQTNQLPDMNIYWSENNTTAEGNIALGEIGTSYYSNGNLYLLGDADVDTDEYDSHVILHEWIHFLETHVSRSNSLGGDHSAIQKLDMRLAFSEGLANAFSAILLDDSFYVDSLGIAQATGFYFNVAEKSHSVKGWYSEKSVESIIYNYYLSADNRPVKSFDDLFATFTRQEYIYHSALMSIFVFAEVLQQQAPAAFPTWINLQTEQNINSYNGFAEGETNAGGYVENLPLYKTVSFSNSTVSLCSSNRFGSFNRLSNYQFVKILIDTPGTYRIQAVNTVGSNTDPELYLYSAGQLINTGLSSTVNQESLEQFLSPSTYVLTLADARVLNQAFVTDTTSCFNVSLIGVND